MFFAFCFLNVGKAGGGRDKSGLQREYEGLLKSGHQRAFQAWRIRTQIRPRTHESAHVKFTLTGVATALRRVFTLMLWCVCKYINKSASPWCAFTPVWSICSSNNLLLSKWVNCKCIKCTISTDVSSWTHNHVVMNAVTGKCSPLYQLALVLHYLTLIVLLAMRSCHARHIASCPNSWSNSHFRCKVNLPFFGVFQKGIKRFLTQKARKSYKVKSIMAWNVGRN